MIHVPFVRIRFTAHSFRALRGRPTPGREAFISHMKATSSCPSPQHHSPSSCLQPQQADSRQRRRRPQSGRQAGARGRAPGRGGGRPPEPRAAAPLRRSRTRCERESLAADCHPPPAPIHFMAAQGAPSQQRLAARRAPPPSSCTAGAPPFPAVNFMAPPSGAGSVRRGANSPAPWPIGGAPQ